MPPGKAAFPLHHHRANEEHFFVLSGRGVLRVGAETVAVEPHDYIFNPPGDAAEAHQLINTGDADLVYLAFSTAQMPEVVGYPDSGRPASGSLAAQIRLRDSWSGTTAPRAEYYDGEDGAVVAGIVRRERGTG